MPNVARKGKGASPIRKQPPSDKRQADRTMVQLPRPRPAVKPLAAKRTAQAGKVSEEVSRRLLRMLEDSQHQAAAPLGMVKCPLCGTPLEPTQNGRVRTHDNALEHKRCPASGERWESLDRPVAKPSARKQVPAPARKSVKRTSTVKKAKSR